MELPKDPMMLFSFINMKLRDYYPFASSTLCRPEREQGRYCEPSESGGIRIQPLAEQVLVKKERKQIKKGCLPKGKQPLFILSGVISIKHD